MSDSAGITGAMASRIAQQQVAAAAAQLGQPQNASVHQALVGVPGVVRVSVAPQQQAEEQRRSKKPVPALTPSRTHQHGGKGLLATAPVANTAGGAELLASGPAEGGAFGAVEERATSQARLSSTQLPSASNLVWAAKSKIGPVYLEQERWDQHIRPLHITNPPMARGKSQTTWWPVQYAASGTPSMTEQQVKTLIHQAAENGVPSRAQRDTRLLTYDLPQADAERFGVSQVWVSTTPDGRVLSAYPKFGTNVFAVKELKPGEQVAPPAAQQPATPGMPGAEDDRMYQTKIQPTQFG